MIQDQKLMVAVSKILQRSERQVDDQKMLETFVDLGILAQLATRNNQIIYGRRGTGKTHVFRDLDAQLESQDPNNVVVYIDARTLGSSAQFGDASLDMQRRVVALLRDIFGSIYNDLLEEIIEKGGDNAKTALTVLDTLLPAITEPGKIETEETQTTATASAGSSDGTASVGAKAGPLSASIGGSSKSEQSDSSKIEKKFEIQSDKVIFPALSEPLAQVLKLTGTQLYILIDEWSSLPADLQPYLAEFIKRTLLPLQDVTIKIAALEYRAHFSLQTAKGLIGFELGADISTAPDLDDYYVYDRNPDKITSTYGDILFRHLSVELPADYLEGTYGILTGDDLGSKLFTQRPTLRELARASEGVIRDLINIFTKAFFHAQRRGRDTIDQKAVLEASREWFEQDKARGLDPELTKALRTIVDQVIGQRRARSFLMQRDLERLPVIQRLIDARVLHHIARGYADKDYPGVRYNIYSVDYGTYVDLLNTSKEPQIDLIDGGESTDVVVPFDDKRSIRRIIFGASDLAEGVTLSDDEMRQLGLV
jgi:hypothetical protein